jgi:hypothetical protein
VAVTVVCWADVLEGPLSPTEDESSEFHGNVGTYAPEYMASHQRNLNAHCTHYGWQSNRCHVAFQMLHKIKARTLLVRL